ncbi:hypothetical protein JCM13304A_17880 [Desulfothermus okinawensis JCM 13304]
MGFCSSIRFKDIALVPDNFIRFKDIVIINDHDQLSDDIKDLPLLDISDYPKKFTLQKEFLKKIISENLPKNLVSRCDLPDKIHIYKGSLLVTKDKIFSLLVDFVKKNASQLNGELRLRDVVIPEYLILGSGEKIYIQTGQDPIKPGSNNITFVIYRDKRILRKKTGRFFLDVYRAVPCARRPLNIGEVLTFDKITFVKKNIAYISKNIWDGKSGPYRIKVPIGAMQPITMERLEPLPVVSRGQKVKLVYEGSSILLKTIGKCLEDGNIGDFIKVMNIQSHRIVYAKVINRDTVKVE